MLRNLATLVLLGLALDLRGDIYRVIGKGNTIAPLRSSEVSMDAETVVVKPEKAFGGFHVSAVFTMRNTVAEAVTYDVAFPFEDRRLASIARESFKVRLGTDDAGALVTPIDLKVRDEAVKMPRSPHDFAAALVWKISWAANETKLIRVSYDMGEHEDYRGLVEGWRLRYIVKTGALWKGPIGRADITILLSDHPILSHDMVAIKDTTNLGPGVAPLFSYAANATRRGYSDTTWHFENWTPDEDVWLGVLRWQGITPDSAKRIWLRTPAVYGGAVETYTDAMLERITDTILADWRELFPLETKRDRGAVTSFVAEWMYRELFARHGDPFVLGKRRAGEPEPPGSMGYDQDGNYHSIWASRFPPKWRGGWYEPKPGRGPDGSVPVRDLTAQEQKNAAFLRTYFEP